MNRIWKSILTGIVVMVAGLASAQTFTPFNPPPCDFSQRFYNQNGIDTSFLVGEFGVTRLNGPPAQPNQTNWVNDAICAATDPTRANVRILATTGALRDSDGAPTEFFSLVAFMNNGNVFLATENDQEGDTPITIANSVNVRGITQRSLISNFVAYAAVKQKIANGTLAPTPCGSLFGVGSASKIAAGDCFNIDSLPATSCPGTDASVPCFAINTFNLRQDWRLTSNRNAIDGSDNNCVNTQDQNCKANNLGLNDSPFGYFCDDLLGTWLIHYWWYNENAIGGTDSTGHPINPTSTCTKILSCAASVNGTSLDGTPIIKTGAQLRFLEGVTGTPASVFPNQSCIIDSDLPFSNGACAVESSLGPGVDGGAGSGATWIICPDLPDPRNGAIASDAFLDAVRLPSGAFQNQDIAKNFTCLQQTGKLCSESAPGQ